MIPVFWWAKERMSYSCCHMLNEIFDFYGCEHFSLAEPLPEAEGCIFMFHGSNMCLGNLGEKAAQLFNNFASHRPWVIFVSIGDERTEFPLHLLSHPNSRLWVQAPLPTTKAGRYLIQGYPANTRRIADVPKNMDWAFCGQDTHERRHACIKALRSMDVANNVVLGTPGFGRGMDQLGYLVTMSVVRMAPCPAGPQTPDTFRVYEALECGAIPILDAVSLRPETRGVWPLLLGDHPLPVIEDWATLPDVMAEWLKDWEDKARWIQMWWRSYKKDMQSWLAKDLISLGALSGREKEASAGITQAT